jgi:hypothetical protein
MKCHRKIFSSAETKIGGGVANPGITASVTAREVTDWGKSAASA